MLLSERLMKPLPGEEKELDHLDVGRQGTGMQRLCIGEIRIAAEQPIDHRTDEALLEQALRLRLFQRQRREQRQIDGAVGGGARVQRIDDVVGLAKPQRQPNHEFGSDITDDVFGDRLGVRKDLRHHG